MKPWILFKFLMITLITSSLSSMALSSQSNEPIYVGCKKFTENYILAEMFSQLLEEHGYKVQRRFGMAGTLIVYEALKEGAIDVYPEYSGTIAQVILKKPKASFEELKEDVKIYNLELLDSIGFSNSYAFVVRKDTQETLKLQKISDLLKHPLLKGALEYEFMERQDGWKVLKRVYGLNNKTHGMEQFLAYEALEKEQADFSLAYTTDPIIKKRNLTILKDDRNFFPKYYAMPFINKNLSPKVKKILNLLSGKITSNEMIELNNRAIEGESFASVARHFLSSKDLIVPPLDESLEKSRKYVELLTRVKEHLTLTFLAVFLATLIAIPLAVLILKFRWLAQVVLGIAGLLQTIPSIALLTLMIPLFGIGFKPALVALLLYSILPILRNTYTALNSIDPKLITAAQGLGLFPSEIFYSIKFPLSLPMILTGVRMATIISIGTATLAAFIGAGGLGEPIVTGLALNDTNLILQGAIPAAGLAIIADLIFSGIEKVFVKTL